MPLTGVRQVFSPSDLRETTPQRYASEISTETERNQAAEKAHGKQGRPVADKEAKPTA
jgi:hypothetical protein